jgi:hypothetical protein
MKKLLIIIGVTIGLNTALADWPKKLWEKELPEKVRWVGDHVTGSDTKSIVLTVGLGEIDQKKFWVSERGEFYELSHNFDYKQFTMFFDSKNFVYYNHIGNTGHKRVIKLSRVGFEVLKRQFEAKLEEINSFRWHSSHISFQIDNNKITAWDFTPPTSTAPKPDGGGNETVNSRLIIKTSGPDIALATDGKLGGAAELQKSNDLRSWRRLGDVPAEASEVLVTPRESGNEFYRLKKK